MRSRFWARTGSAVLLVGGVWLSAGEAAAAPEKAVAPLLELHKVLIMLVEVASGPFEDLLRGWGGEGIGKTGAIPDPNGGGSGPSPDQGGIDIDPNGGSLEIDPLG